MVIAIAKPVYMQRNWWDGRTDVDASGCGLMLPLDCISDLSKAPSMRAIAKERMVKKEKRMESTRP